MNARDERERARRHNLLSPTFLLENAKKKKLGWGTTCDVLAPRGGACLIHVCNMAG
jgi:hypothetical protein